MSTLQVLDSALLRPGRFDRQVTVDRPDVQGRIKILGVHSRGKTIGKDVDFEKISRRTPGTHHFPVALLHCHGLLENSLNQCSQLEYVHICVPSYVHLVVTMSQIIQFKSLVPLIGSHKWKLHIKVRVARISAAPLHLYQRHCKSRTLTGYKFWLAISIDNGDYCSVQIGSKLILVIILCRLHRSRSAESDEWGRHPGCQKKFEGDQQGGGQRCLGKDHCWPREEGRNCLGREEETSSLSRGTAFFLAQYQDGIKICFYSSSTISSIEQKQDFLTPNWPVCELIYQSLKTEPASSNSPVCELIY